VAAQGVTVVTGGGSGIGEALSRRFGANGSPVAVVDRDLSAATRVADSIEGAVPFAVDVGVEAEVDAMVAEVGQRLGPISLYCSNAGIITGPDLGDDQAWAAGWAVHVMAHVYAARVVLPDMAERGGGAMVLTASAAGLLTMMGSAAYSVTKHGTVALAEWLSINWGDRGVHIACLCPQGVRTPMLASDTTAAAEVEASGVVLEPSEVADRVAEAIEQRQFLILPHPEVRRYEAARAADRDRWLTGMRRLNGGLRPSDS
jgi:NAD(P)-dependent dehydrogenase (short-subunit alcohol dehydrogenase family)